MANIVKRKKLPKATKGLQEIQAQQQSQRQLISGGLSTAANAVLPGAGTAISALEGASSLLKDENGLYKSKVGQGLDVLNPVTAVTRVASGVGKIFKGDWKGLNDLDGQQAIKDAIKEQKNEETRQSYWGSLTTEKPQQKAMYKQGGKKVATKAIEIEGGEPHFSKKVNGKRTLKLYAPNGPTHEQGGIPVLAADGDAVVTAKKGLGAKAVAAHQAGDHKAVEKIISKMPEDKPAKKKTGGVRASKPPTLTMQQKSIFRPIPEADLLAKYDQQFTKAPAPINPLAVGYNMDAPSPSGNYAGAKAALVKGSTPDYKSNILQGVQAAPAIYALGQGLFGKVEKTKRRTYSPEALTYTDNSQSARKASVQQQSQEVASARNLSGGSAGNVRSNQRQAFAGNFNRQQAISSMEADKQQLTSNQNTEMRNRAKAVNLQMNQEADIYDLQNKEKKQEALSKGLQGIGALAGGVITDRMAAKRDTETQSEISQMFKNYELKTLPDGTTSWQLKKSRNGLKNIKAKHR